MWDLINELKPLAAPIPTDKERSAIETRFPHIARELCALWKTGQIDLYLDDLLLDSRGGRQGFPADVLDELMSLSGMRWHLYHEVERAQPRPGLFSFAAMNEADLAHGRSARAWVF
ncbi:MAG TPA: hypothetical protein PKH69_08865 [Thiobacillaceae bacterium]|nr:hypothetical protein [Thiobacillaceae bacterium]HNU64520.1 hypothetical protein [Thiobacillaceae bacterium]